MDTDPVRLQKAQKSPAFGFSALLLPPLKCSVLQTRGPARLVCTQLPKLCARSCLNSHYIHGVLGWQLWISLSSQFGFSCPKLNLYVMAGFVMWGSFGLIRALYSSHRIRERHPISPRVQRSNPESSHACIVLCFPSVSGQTLQRKGTWKGLAHINDFQALSFSWGQGKGEGS